MKVLGKFDFWSLSLSLSLLSFFCPFAPIRSPIYVRQIPWHLPHVCYLVARARNSPICVNRVACILFCRNWRLALLREHWYAKSEERRVSMAFPLGGACILLGIVRLSRYRFNGTDALKAVCAKSLHVHRLLKLLCFETSPYLFYTNRTYRILFVKRIRKF